jgi:ribosomal protein S18 acetylase RimI-like enzyme
LPDREVNALSRAPNIIERPQTALMPIAPHNVGISDHCAEASADFAIRDARASDNAQLIALAAACPMRGEVSLRIDRGPDFFALNRLEGARWKVGVAERRGVIVGCVAASERRCFVNGRERLTGYAGDLKVHPEHRNTTIADELSWYAERAFLSLPATAPVLITVLAGNRAMERRLPGPRGVPAFRRAGTIRTYSVPILWRRRAGRSIRIAPAQWSDLEQMSALWTRVAPLRQLAPVLSVAAMAEWIDSTPGLDISSYRLARSQGGELLGFFAVWDQRAFKQLNVVGYSPRMKAARAMFNMLAPIVGGVRMPKTGQPLNCITIAHVCVPGERPEVLRALLISTHNELRRTGISFINVGLDTRDPLSPAMDGLLAQPTDVNAYLTKSRSGVLSESLDEGPIHYEIALV